MTGASAGNRPVYPFSIVPGGVGSKEELRAAMDLDEVVAEHYAAVNVAQLKPVVLAQDTPAYVSFRKQGKVYWTSHKVRLAKGEQVFQGAGIGVRGRCGNQVSEQPMVPVLPASKAEPTTEVFNTPLPQSPPPGLVATIPSMVSGGLHQAEEAEGVTQQPPVGGGSPGIYPVGGGGGVGGVLVAGGGGGGGGSTGPLTAVAPVVPGSSGVILAASGILPPVTAFTPSIYPPPPGLILMWCPPVAPPIVIYPLGFPVVVPPIGPPVFPPGVVPPNVYPPNMIPPAVLPPNVVPPNVVPPNVVPPSTVPPETPPVTPPLTPATPPIAPPVPEPGTWVMLATGLGLVAVGVRRKARIL